MTHHLLKFHGAGLTAIAGINGAPLLVDASGRGVYGAAPANPWLKPSGNAVTIHLAKTAAGTSAVLPPVAPSPVDIRIEFYSVVPGSPTNDVQQMLATFRRTADDTTVLPVQRAIPVQIADVPPASLWSQAAPIRELSATDIAQLTALVEQHIRAIETRNVDAVSALLEYKTTDCALAEGQDPALMRQVIRRQYAQEMFSERSLKITSPPPGKLSFQLVAAKQVVWIYHSLAVPAITVESPEKRFGIELFASKIAGAWRIVR